MKVIAKEVSRDVAKSIYKKYLSLIYDLIFLEKNKFDLILGPADSGIFMAESISLFFEEKKDSGIVMPKIILIPIQRYKKACDDKGEEYDNLQNLLEIERIKSELNGVNKIENILFVDDEISERALTAKAAIELMLEAIPEEKKQKRIVYTIIAENHGFQWRYDIPPVAIRYYAYGKKVRWSDDKDPNTQYHANGTIFAIINDEVYEKYKSLPHFCEPGVAKSVCKKHLAAIFTVGDVKTSNGKFPIMTKDLFNEASKVLGFEKDKEQFLSYVRGFIKEIVEEAPTNKGH